MNEMLALLFAEHIIKGKRQYHEVPALLKPQVKEFLEEQGLGHLAE